MPRYLVIFISPFLYLLSFLLFFYYGRQPIILAIFNLLVVMISLRLATRRHWWHNRLLLVNLLLAYLAQFVFLTLLTPSYLRYLLIFALALVWGLVWWLIGRHFTVLRERSQSEYLAALKFFYYLNFWFWSVSLFALIALVQFPFTYVLLLMVAGAFLWLYHLWLGEESRRWYELLLFSFLMMQIVAALYLLPLSFYGAGTMATLWLFFLVDRVLINLRNFRVYLSLFSASILILLVTAII